MIVTVSANWAQRYLGAEETRLEVAANTTAYEAALQAGIPDDEIGILSINGTMVDAGHTLTSRDVLEVYPMIIGG